MIVEENWRYPVKSMQGKRLEVAQVTLDGGPTWSFGEVALA